MARMEMAEHISISQDATMPRSFSSESSTHGQMRRYVSISFQQRSASASRWYSSMYSSSTTETFASVRALEAGTLEKSV